MKVSNIKLKAETKYNLSLQTRETYFSSSRTFFVMDLLFLWLFEISWNLMIQP